MKLNEDKFAFGLLSLVLTVAGWLLIFKFPPIGQHFPTLVTGIIGIYTIFAGAHVANNWVNTPDQPNITTTTTTPLQSVKVSESPPPAQEPVPPPVAPAVPPHPSLVPPELPLLPALPEIPKSLAEIAKSLEKLAEKKRKKKS